MPIRQRSFRSERVLNSNRNSLRLSDDFNLLNNIKLPEDLGELSITGHKWRREVDLGNAKMETVKIKLSKEILIISYNFDVLIKDEKGFDQEIISQSTRSFTIPPKTKPETIKATLSKGKVTITGEIEQFKSEMNIQIGKS